MALDAMRSSGLLFRAISIHCSSVTRSAAGALPFAVAVITGIRIERKSVMDSRRRPSRPVNRLVFVHLILFAVIFFFILVVYLGLRYDFPVGIEKNFQVVFTVLQQYFVFDLAASGNPLGFL
jgi:hypothetical protein